MSEQKFYFDSLQDTETIAEFLEALRDGFAKEEITVTANGDSITLSPKGLLNFTVKAKHKRGESKLTVRISWKERGGEDGRVRAPLKVK